MVSANYNLLNTNNIAPVTNNKYVSNRILPANILGKDRITFTSNFLTKSSELITKEVLNAVKKENFLGNGVQGDVYKIPNTEYCVKLLNKNRSNPVKTWSFDITPQDRVNHIVAKADNGNTIMRCIQGEALDLEEKPDTIYFLPKIAYKKLIKQIDDAHKIGMFFDNAPMNIVFNPAKKSLTAIDFFKDYGFTYTPIFDVFTTLYNVPSNPKLAKNLSEKLLTLSLDEIEKGAKSEIPLEYSDISSLIDESKKSILSKDTSFEELKKLYKKIFELREAKKYNSKNYVQTIKKLREVLDKIME